MANYIPLARSNYFRVKDAKAFTKRFHGMQGMEVVQDGERVALFCTEGEGAWPSDLYDDESGEYLAYDFFEDLRSHLIPGETVVLMEIGYEKLRYLVGQAHAFQDIGEILTVSLADIYKLAEKRFGKSPTLAES